MTLMQWVSAVLGQVIDSNNEFMYMLIAGVLLVIGFTCALSLFIGIAFAIFRR